MTTFPPIESQGALDREAAMRRTAGIVAPLTTLAAGATLAAAILIGLSHCAHGASLRLYTPGGAPCAGVCTYDWARSAAAVPEGVAEPMIVPAGSIVTWMSYGRGGEPHGGPDSAILATDQPGQGYWFERDGRSYLFVQLDECQNWAVMMAPLQEKSAGAREFHAWYTTTIPSGIPPTRTPRPVTVSIIPIPPGPSPEPIPAPVPLPATGLLLAAALYVLRRIVG